MGGDTRLEFLFRYYRERTYLESTAILFVYNLLINVLNQHVKLSSTLDDVLPYSKLWVERREVVPETTTLFHT